MCFRLADFEGTRKQEWLMFHNLDSPHAVRLEGILAMMLLQGPQCPIEQNTSSSSHDLRPSVEVGSPGVAILGLLAALLPSMNLASAALDPPRFQAEFPNPKPRLQKARGLSIMFTFTTLTCTAQTRLSLRLSVGRFRVLHRRSSQHGRDNRP